uniref:hypothetical protein n=1 Tax=Pararhizobium sp. IMCC3301 TaxID=3067904 RepID=UPI00274173E5|nr:hypothetical protein [Pararhizobium sp. IMCC3301]
MPSQDVKAKIEVIMSDASLSVDDKVRRLERMYQDVREEMRAATESSMVTDDDIGDELQDIEKALDKLNHHPDSIEDSGAATL